MPSIKGLEASTAAPRVRLRFWLESASGLAGTGLFALALVRRDWIEVALGADPDRGSGALELAVPLGLLAVALASLVIALRERRRALTG